MNAPCSHTYLDWDGGHHICRTCGEPVTKKLMEAYSTALDEIWRLRRALAYEARTVEAHYEGYKTFPKSRRKHAEEQVKRMRQLAVGNHEGHYSLNDQWLRDEMVRLGGSQTLTRHQWEAERGIA